MTNPYFRYHWAKARPGPIRALLLALAMGAAAWTAPAPVLAQGAPMALVEGIEGAPQAGVGFLDYVYADQVIDLGASGKLMLSYFQGCTSETIAGGKVTVGAMKSAVAGGTVSSQKIACQSAQIQVSEATSEAGAAVNRVNEFAGQDWSEWTVKSDRPTFKWPTPGTAMVKVVDLDLQPPKVLWSATVEGSHAAYPADAPQLEIGIPYQVEVTVGGKAMKTPFSFDPDLEGPDNMMAKVVPVK